MILLAYPAPAQTSPNMHPALSIFSVGSYLESKGIDVEYWDARVDSDDDLDELISRADMVGVSSLSGYQLTGAIAVLKKAHAAKKLTVFGGTHPSLLPEQSMEDYVDYIVRFEGEQTLLELAQGVPPEEILGLVWRRDNGEVVVNPPRAALETSSLPSVVTDKTAKYFKLSKNLMLESARGCPFHCGFCYLSHSHKSKWRPIPISRIEEDLKNLSGRGIVPKHLLIAGDWNGDSKRVLELAATLHKRGIEFTMNMRADDITLRFANQLKELGARTLQIGLESGSPRILKQIIRKGETIADYVNCASILSQTGIKAEYFVIRGLPTETEKEKEATCAFVDWLRSMHGDNCSVSCFYYVPLPGTPLYEYEKSGPTSLEEWARISRDSSAPEARAWYWVSGLTFNGEPGGKTDKNFPGRRRIIIAPLEKVFRLRWRLRKFALSRLEDWAISKALSLSASHSPASI